MMEGGVTFDPKVYDVLNDYVVDVEYYMDVLVLVVVDNDCA
jgi:hypothetical protein